MKPKPLSSHLFTVLSKYFTSFYLNLIEHILEDLDKAGVTEAILAVNNLADRIEDTLDLRNTG